MIRRLLAAVLLSLVAPVAHAQVALTGGKLARFVDNPTNNARDQATVKFMKDPALLSLLNPLCPHQTKVRLSSSQHINSEITLDCSQWKLVGATYRYTAKPGGPGDVRSIVYRPGFLKITLQGTGYAPPISGPVTFTEARFKIDSTEYCGRFEVFQKNTSSLVLSNKGPSVACHVVCGDGILEGSEICDDGNLINNDGCDKNCTPTGCGNGIKTAGEQCDDGNQILGDGCRPNCTKETCGDGILDPGEECDDGNGMDGDCCSSLCTFEPSGSPCHDDGNVCTDDVCNGAGVCQHLANSASCTDHDLCTTGDTCVGGVCVGTPIKPWINEFDYDDFADYQVDVFNDNDEFIEIAGPPGTDLGGYEVVAVEGNQTCQFTVFTGVTTGNANFTAVIPPNTIIHDDTGSGMGFVTLCFTQTSTRHELAGECDVILPAPSSESNLQNGDIVNSSPTNCPDGILLLDPDLNYVDSVSYEGVVPNVGSYGPFFHIDATTAYSVGVDQGFKTGVSFEKISNTLGRATSAAEWTLSGNCTTAGLNDATCMEFSDSPGRYNPGQSMHCDEFFCGDGIVGEGEECDDGAGNSNAPDAHCRTDCTLRRCGDGIVDPTAAPNFAEQCEQDSDCSAGQHCFACQCVTGTPLGDLLFTVVPGPADLNPPDDGQSTLLRVTPTFNVTNGSAGNWSSTQAVYAGGVPDANGIAAFVLTAPVVLEANLPSLAGTDRICVRVHQDPNNRGRIDCNGGSNLDVKLSIDSNGTGPDGSPVLTVGGGATDSGPGAAVAYVIVETGSATASQSCAADGVYDPPIATAITTASATSEILDARQGGTATVVQSGQPFHCSNWVVDAGASTVSPAFSPDLELPFGLGTIDVAEVLRLNDD